MSERAKSSFRPGSTAHSGTPADHRLQRVMQAIEADPSLDIHDLAHLVQLSSSRLSHLFKAANGFSLQTYLSNCRLKTSAELLQSTEMPIKEVSYAVGYRHAPSFVRAFRNKFGSSPTDYRNQQRLLLSDSRFG